MMRKIDAVTAVRPACPPLRNNLRPMLLWAGLIAGFMTRRLGHPVPGPGDVFPLIGYATWHAFRDVVRALSRPATCERADLAWRFFVLQGAPARALQVLELAAVERPQEGRQSRPGQATARRG